VEPSRTPRRKIYGVFITELIITAALFLLGSTTKLHLLGFGAFLAYFSMPLLQTCSQTIWQRKTAPDIQGRVFSFRRVIAWSSLPLAYLAAGPLADKVFTPLLLEGGALAGSVGRLLGVGPGRGIGLLYIVLGLVTFAATAVAYAYTPLRNVETLLPDQLPEQAAVK